MFNLLALVNILLFFKLSASHPFIFEKFSNICTYNSSHNSSSTVTLNSKLYKVERNGILIYYTLCDYLPEEINCGLNVAACLKDTNDNSSHIIGKQFILGNNNSESSYFSLKAVSGGICNINTAKKYKVTIIFLCQHEMEVTRLEKKSDCEYNIYMIHPNCSLPCTTEIHGQLIDLRKLKGNYLVQSKEKNFTVALCNATRNCSESDKHISVCEMSSTGMIPLSSIDNEKIVYHPQQNEIVYRGSYKGENGIRKFELLLNCNWENLLDSNKIKYKEVQRQGKNYKFVMDSSYGCIKLPPKCVIEDGPLIYNLTNLFKSTGYVVSNVPNGHVSINICGPLKNYKLKHDDICSRSFSQVCQLKDGSYINRGSILAKFEVVHDVVKVTYANGMNCKEEPSRQYSTHIDFFCSKTEYGPKFVNSDKCDLFINWSTPQACPVYDKSSCENKQEKNQDCSVIFQGQHYDFSSLKHSGNYHEIVDPKNHSIKYFLNVCGSVIDPDAPCMRDSMVIMKDMEQKHVKYRIKSLGKMDAISIIDDHIVVKTLSGTYCGIEGDYTSNLHLICSDKEEPPQLVSHTKCSFIFQWKTPVACLNKAQSTAKQCIIKDTSGDNMLDFTKSTKTSLKIIVNKRTYMFDLCQDNYTMYSVDNQAENKFFLEKRLLSSNGTMFLDISLSKVCDSKSGIDKLLFQLVCDRITNNEHFNFQKEIDNCTVKLLFYTNLVCGKEEYQLNITEGNGKYDIVNENNMGQENCSIANHLTGYKMYTSSLYLNIPVDDCPAVFFYDHNSSAVLLYPSTEICNNATYEYKVILKCSNQELREIRKMDCLELHHLEGPEFCKIFETVTLDVSQKNNTVIIVLSIFGVILCLGACLFCFCKWKNYFRRLHYFTVYEKDADI